MVQINFIEATGSLMSQSTKSAWFWPKFGVDGDWILAEMSRKKQRRLWLVKIVGGGYNRRLSAADSFSSEGTKLPIFNLKFSPTTGVLTKFVTGDVMWWSQKLLMKLVKIVGGSARRLYSLVRVNLNFSPTTEVLTMFVEGDVRLLKAIYETCYLEPELFRYS